MTDFNQKYQVAVSRLNPAQRLAVETIDGPVMVVAGPGTGKTQVLALRIGHILKETDTASESVLVLTFTDAAAANMRARLTTLLGPTAYKVRITTFHGLCQQVISDHPEVLSFGDSQLLTDIERFSLVESGLISSENSDFLQKTAPFRPVNAPLYYVPSLISAFSDLKREGVTPEKLDELVRQTVERLLLEKEDTRSSAKQTQLQAKADKLEALAHLYAWYQDELHRRGRYDFDDMVLCVLQSFSTNPEIAVEYQEQFQYVMVDEFQDTNSAQAGVLSQLCSFWGQSANVCVVGDPHQSIFRFQGASTENVLNFASLYPEAQVIVLDTGYRCDSQIYAKAHQLIMHSSLDFLDGATHAAQKVKQALQTPLRSGVESKETQEATAFVQVLSLPTSTDEATWIAHQIAQKIAQGARPADIAVLYRTHKESEPVVAALQAVGLSWWREGQRDVSTQPVIAQMLLFLRVLDQIYRGQEPEGFVPLLLYAWTPLLPQDVVELQYYAVKSGGSLWEWSQLDHLEKITAVVPERLHSSLTLLAGWTSSLRRWSGESTQQLLQSWWLRVLDDSGYLSWVASQSQSLELVSMVQGVLEQFGQWCDQDVTLDLPGLVAIVDTLSTHKLPLSVDVPPVTQEGLVCLTTAHRAKGREWQYVFVVGAVDGAWGGTRKRQLIPFPDGILRHTDLAKHELDEDSRRLWYVALTRAKQQAVFTFSQTKISSGKIKELAASQFVFEMGVEPQQATSPDTSLEGMAKSVRHTQVDSLSGLRQACSLALEDFVLSNAALTDYLHDPRQFFLHRLLKLPRPLEEAALFGVCVHATLEKMLRPMVRGGRLPPLDELQVQLEAKLSEVMAKSIELPRRLESARGIVERCYEWYAQHPPLLFGVEQMVGTKGKPLYFGDIPLTGRLDRVDWADQKHTSLVLIDYKTGKPKSAAALTGPTQSQMLPLSARELELPTPLQSRYRRQLLFYAVLVSLDKRFPSIVSQGQFIFVEGEATARQPGLIARTLPVVPEELELMKTLITDVMREIRSLDFLETIQIS